MSNLITPFVTISYPLLFEAKARKDNPTGPKKFSASFLFTKEQFEMPEMLKIREACTQCAVDKFGKVAFEAMLAEETFQPPFRKDITAKGYPSKFFRYISSSSGADYPPAVVDREGKPLTDRSKIYAGAVVRASLATRAYGGPGTPYKPGVMLDLRNVQWIEHGERLAAGGSGDGSEFAALPPLPAADVLGDMMN